MSVAEHEHEPTSTPAPGERRPFFVPSSPTDLRS
jgi:hypothetical protein